VIKQQQPDVALMEIKAYSLLQNIKKFLAPNVQNAMQIKRFW
jgi:hypothetical protein